MHRSRGAPSSSGAAGIFAGVRFVLLGFDSVSEAQYRSELVRAGGVDVGRYDGSCTHVIVCGRVYDDPLCVAARNDGKVLVTELWIEDSLDRGILADATRILYSPVKDLNGIPGSKSLHMCLTGYQRQGREDIMKMVALMGSKFSKPLIANQVTHLICYKFEGEKYELAKKVNIKLVNERWLEDCLKSWEILPIDNYTKSGWELEMEAEAKDSEDEREDSKKSSSRRNSAGNSGFGGGILGGGSNLSIQSVGDLRLPKDTVTKTESPVSGSPFATTTLFRVQCKDDASGRSMPVCNPSSKIHDPNGGDAGHASRDHSMSDFAIDGDLSKLSNSDLKEASFPAETVSASSAVDVKSSALKYSRRHLSPSYLPELPVDASGARKMFSNETASKVVFNISPSGRKESGASDDSAKLPGLTSQVGRSNIEAERTTSLQKRKISASGRSSKSPKSECESSVHSALQQSSPNAESAEVESPPSPPENKDPVLPKGHSNENSFKVVSNISRSNQKESRVTDDSTKTPGLTTHARSSAAAKCSALPQKRKLSISGGSSKSSKSECQSSIHAVLNPSPNAESTEVEAPLSPPGNKDPVLRDTSHTFDDAVQSNSEAKQAPVSKFESIDCRKKSLSSAKPVTGEISNALLSSKANKKDVPSPKQANTVLSSKANKKDVPSPKQVLGEQECLGENLSNTAPAITDRIVSSWRSPFNLHLDNGLMQKENQRETIITAIQFDSLAIGQLTDKAVLNEERPKMPLVGPQEPESATNALNGEAIDVGMEDLRIKDQTEIEKFQKDKVSISPNDRVMAAGNSSSAINSNLSDENNGKVTFGTHSKKAIAKMSFNSISKIKSLNNGKGKDARKSNKAPMNAGAITGKVDEMVLLENKKLGRNLKNGSVESLSGVEVLKEGTEPAEYHTPAYTKEDVAMDCKETTSIDSEKENIPREADRFHSNYSSNHNNNLVDRDDPNLIKSPKNSVKKEKTKIKKFNLGPAWFILSGHRPQRKEFQAIIKQLRGKICRDSHHWSYQATHFIVPEPVRRTEKFFAAAAAGRWILKADYLSSSKEAGKFLDEQPFEWNRKGLTEDGAISLEAPRKWRLLRERTGHGAFYRMRIVIYGECIAPALDTLKRVVKAGDGIILATSPPYTRFLKSGVDYAIVSPSMPRVDSWVQEFLRHEVPCVAADYLVEYVCKPGHSLERHVLYNTHAWAERSFANMLSRSEEICEEDSSPPLISEEECTDELSCAVCGSRDRGEVMLICGDEAGTAGCGIGTHIDCCDPPLVAVPEEDWFCPKCCCRIMPNKATLKNTKLKSSSKAKSSIIKRRSSSRVS